MGKELTFAAITPRSLAKGVTGGITARLLATPGLEFVGVRMYAPSGKFVDDYLNIVHKVKLPRKYKQAYLEHVDTAYRRETCLAKGYTNRLMVFFFRGANARQRLTRDVIGGYDPNPSAKTIRDSYGTYTMLPDGSIHDFHPAVDAPHSDTSNRELLRLLARYAEKDGGVLEHVIPDTKKKKMQTTLVMIKPDILKQPSTLPGSLIGVLSTIGLYIVGARLVNLSVEQGFQFYGFLENIFVDKLAYRVDRALRRDLKEAFDFDLDDEDYAAMTDLLRQKNAHCEVCKIIEYMTGTHPDEAKTKSARRQPGPARCFALLYRGEDTIRKVRQKLGETDPSKAKAGTIRADYGFDLMRNGMHASDSIESAVRERKIVGLWGDEPSEEKRMIQRWIHGTR